MGLQCSSEGPLVMCKGKCWYRIFNILNHYLCFYFFKLISNTYMGPSRYDAGCLAYVFHNIPPEKKDEFSLSLSILLFIFWLPVLLHPHNAVSRFTNPEYYAVKFKYFCKYQKKKRIENHHSVRMLLKYCVLYF